MRGDRGRVAALLAAVLLAAGAAGCVRQMSEVRTSPGTSPAPGTPWTPPAAPPAPPSAQGTPAIPPDLLKSAQDWGLTDLVDLALRDNPQTRLAWAAARAAAAGLGSAHGAYYPALAFQTNASRIKGSAVGGQFTFNVTSTNPFLALNYLLFDFGGRKGAVEEARQALMAADWSHNATIQDVVLRVEQAYHGYLNARAIEQAEQAAVKEAQASLDAAEARHAAGLGTLADVLQARTALSQARLLLETAQGGIQVLHGVVATSIGLPANTPFEVTLPAGDLPLKEGALEVDRAIEQAQALRPDLAAARARVQQADAHTRVVRSQGRPTLAASANGGRIFYDPSGIHQDTYTGTLLLTVPIFNGGTYQYNVFRAEADADAARAEALGLEQQVVFDVWSSYFNHKTAAQKVETTRDLIESARQSYEVAAARYKAGVGSILDLLTAEKSLEAARAQEAQARTDWFLSLAQLAHDTGTLWRPGAGDTKGTP